MFTHGNYRLAGNTFAEVPQSVASNWMKMFENDVVEAGTAQRELGGLGAELAAARTRIVELEAELAKLKAKKAKKEETV
jgi:predicted  nucleic acid-binding Zn-ribbon protein